MIRHTMLGVVLLAVGAVGPLAAQAGTGQFLTPSNEQAVTRVGTRGANFIEIGVGARGLAMGGAYAGMARGATAMYWNPAFLGEYEGLVAAFTHAELYGDLGLSHDFGAVGLPVFGGGLGISWVGLNSGDIPRTTEFDPAGENNEFGSVFEYGGAAVGIHYGRRLTDRLMIGAGAQVITEGMDQAKATWWGLNVGTAFNTGLYGLELAGAVLNVGPSAKMEGALIQQRINNDEVFPVAVPVRYNTVAYQLPTMFRFAVVSNLMGSSEALFSPGSQLHWRLAVDVVDAVDTDVQTALGTEFNYRDLVFVRAGKRWVNEASTEEFRSFSHGLAVGGGLALPLFGQRLFFDYAYQSLGELQNTHVFSFEFGR